MVENLRHGHTSNSRNTWAHLVIITAFHIKDFSGWGLKWSPLGRGHEASLIARVVLIEISLVYRENMIYSIWTFSAVNPKIPSILALVIFNVDTWWIIKGFFLLDKRNLTYQPHLYASLHGLMGQLFFFLDMVCPVLRYCLRVVISPLVLAATNILGLAYVFGARWWHLGVSHYWLVFAEFRCFHFIILLN